MADDLGDDWWMKQNPERTKSKNEKSKICVDLSTWWIGYKVHNWTIIEVFTVARVVSA